MVLSLATLMFSNTSKSLLLVTSSTLEPNRYYSNPLLWVAHGSYTSAFTASDVGSGETFYCQTWKSCGSVAMTTHYRFRVYGYPILSKRACCREAIMMVQSSWRASLSTRALAHGSRRGGDDLAVEGARSGRSLEVMNSNVECHDSRVSHLYGYTK